VYLCVDCQKSEKADRKNENQQCKSRVVNKEIFALKKQAKPGLLRRECIHYFRH
jgi:DNA-directed RNA polymerase subunit RPC12/RpoP